MTTFRSWLAWYDSAPMTTGHLFWTSVLILVVAYVAVALIAAFDDWWTKRRQDRGIVDAAMRAYDRKNAPPRAAGPDSDRIYLAALVTVGDSREGWSYDVE